MKLDHWQRAARTREGAERAVWDQIDWDSGTQHCLSEIIPAIEEQSCGSSARVVEIGCGVGRLTIPLALRWPLAHFVGIDTSEHMLTWARRELNERSVDRGERIENVTFLQGDANALRCGPFDAAYSVLVFQHLDHDTQREYLRKLGIWLVRDGLLRLQYVPEGDSGPLNHPTSPDTMRQWCRENGLRVEAENVDPRYETWRWLTARRV